MGGGGKERGRRGKRGRKGEEREKEREHCMYSVSPCAPRRGPVAANAHSHLPGMVLSSTRPAWPQSNFRGIWDVTDLNQSQASTGPSDTRASPCSGACRGSLRRPSRGPDTWSCHRAPDDHPGPSYTPRPSAMTLETSTAGTPSPKRAKRHTIQLCHDHRGPGALHWAFEQ